MLAASAVLAVLAEVVPEEIQGLPAHPLIVHLPVVMVPLAATGAFAAFFAPRWRSWLLPLTAVLALAGTVGIQLAIWSGENLEEEEGGPLVDQHADLARQTRPIVVVFLVLAIAAAVVSRRARLDADDQPASAAGATTPGSAGAGGRSLERARAATVILCALSLLLGALSTAWVARTGHKGAQAVWDEEDDDGGGGGNRGPGGGDREEREDDDDSSNRGPGGGGD